MRHLREKIEPMSCSQIHTDDLVDRESERDVPGSAQYQLCVCDVEVEAMQAKCSNISDGKTENRF